MHKELGMDALHKLGYYVGLTGRLVSFILMPRPNANKYHDKNYYGYQGN
jgi:hypothetical protein